MRRIVRWGRSSYETDVDLERERAGARDLGFAWQSAPDPSGVPDAVSDCDVVVVTSACRVAGSFFDCFDGDLVVTTTSGVDHIDLARCQAQGIAVCRSPVARRDAVVEQTLACLTWGLRRFPALGAAGRAGRWARGELPGLAPRAFGEATIAVVGLGVIGSRVAAALASFGAVVLGVDPAGVPAPAREATLDEALAVCDAVTLHCQLTGVTQRLLDERRLARLGRHAVIVNTARGGLLDVEAAVAAVRAGTLGALAVDVFPTEPYPALATGSAVPGVFFTPHSAGFSVGLGARVASEVVAALAAYDASAPLPNQVV